MKPMAINGNVCMCRVHRWIFSFFMSSFWNFSNLLFQIWNFQIFSFRSSHFALPVSRYHAGACARFTFLEENIKRSDILTIIYNEEMMIMRRLMVGENTCKKQVMTDGRWRRQHHIASVKNIRNQIKYIQESRLFSPLTLVTLLYCLFIVSFY